MTEDNKNLTEKAPGALAATGAPRRGFEEPTQQEDLVIPRAKLLQGLSPEVVEKAKAPDGTVLESGMIINSLTKEILPSVFIPVFKFTNWIRFNPRNKKEEGFDPAYEPGAIIWRSVDPMDPRVQEEAKFGPNGEKPLATKFLNFFSLFPGVGMPIIVSFSKTSFNAGRRLLTMGQFSGKDMFAKKYELAAKQEAGDAGVYFVLTVEAREDASEEEYGTAAQLWEQFHARAIQVHDAGGDDASTEGSAQEAPPEF
jgi:hypothetical protein